MMKFDLMTSSSHSSHPYDNLKSCIKKKEKNSVNYSCHFYENLIKITSDTKVLTSLDRSINIKQQLQWIFAVMT